LAISQLRIAEVLQIEREIAELQDRLNHEYFEIACDLRAGAKMEPGPHRIRFQQKLIIR
jgi:hypothetical protein